MEDEFDEQDEYDYETVDMSELLEIIFERLALIEGKLDMIGNLVAGKDKRDLHQESIVSKNDITGDNLVSKALTKKGLENWDLIFKPKQKEIKPKDNDKEKEMKKKK